MNVYTLALGSLNTNCYIVHDPSNNHCIIIDPADEGSVINEFILSNQFNPQAIFITHGHFDHLLATLEVKIAWDIPTYINQPDTFLVKTAQSRAEYWLKRQVDPIPPADKYFQQIKMPLLNGKISLIETPGHTPGSVCFYLPQQQILFTGDTLFADQIGRSDLSYSDSHELKKSLEKILSLPDETIIYPGHGANSTIYQIKKMML